MAERARVSHATVRRAVDRLDIAVTRIGGSVRVTEAAYREWIRRNTTEALL